MESRESDPFPCDKNRNVDDSTMLERHQLLLAEEQKMVDIKNPHHNDVLSGRGVKTNRHPGNESFRSLVGLNKVRKCGNFCWGKFKFFLISSLQILSSSLGSLCFEYKETKDGYFAVNC